MVDDLADMIRADRLRLFLKKDKFSQIIDAAEVACSPLGERMPILLMGQ